MFSLIRQLEKPHLTRYLHQNRRECCMHHFYHFVHQRCMLCQSRQQLYDHTGDTVSVHTDHHLVMEVAELAICMLLENNNTQ